MHFNWTHLTMFGTAIVLLSVCFVDCNNNCQSECQLSPWTPWQCTYCCKPENAMNAAYRDKSICCSNITDGQMCLDHCNSLGYNLTVTENGACTIHCPCSSTATLPTSPISPTYVTGQSAPTPTGTSTSVKTRTRGPLTTIASSKGIPTIQTHTSDRVSQYAQGRVTQTTAQARASFTAVPASGGIDQSMTTVDPQFSPDAQRNTGTCSCIDEYEHTKSETDKLKTTLYSWMIPTLVLMVSLVALQCYILYRLYRPIAKVQTAMAPGQPSLE